MDPGESASGSRSRSSRRSRRESRRTGSSSSIPAYSRPPSTRRYRRAGVVVVEQVAEIQTSTGAGFHAEAAGRTNGGRQAGYYASSNGSSDSESDNMQNNEDCSTLRAGPSRSSDHHRQLGHAHIHIHDELGGCCSSSLSSSTASSRYYGSSNTSPASPPFAATLKPTSAVQSRPGSPPAASSYRTGSPAADEEEFVSRVRAGLDPKSKPFPSSSSSTTSRHGGARRSPRGSTTPHTSRPSTRRHSRRNSTSINYRPAVLPRSLPSLSPEAVQQLITVSLYTLVTIVAGVALIGILAGSYALSVGDDLKDRLIEAKLSAAEAVELAKQEALKIKVTLEKRVKQVGDSWNVPATEEDRPNYRELFGHLFQQVTPPFIYSISLHCFRASSATYSTVSSIYDCATRKRTKRSSMQGKQDSSNPPPSRPPLKSLIPSLTLAVLLATFAFVRNTSFWQARQQKTAAYSTGERRRASRRTQ